jgi:hypothetical protein
MPRMYSATGRSRCGGVAFALTHQDAPGATAVTTSPSDVPTPSSIAADTGVADDENAAPPTGCLGGLDRNADMVLTAQKEASHTPYGAVEVAAAFYRFVWQFPTPSLPDVKSVQDRVISANAPESYRDLTSLYAAHPNVSAGEVGDGHAFHLATTNGIWMIDPSSSNDRVTVSIAGGYVIDGALSATRSTGQGFSLQWEDGEWRIIGGVQPDGAVLANGGVHFAGGC